MAIGRWHRALAGVGAAFLVAGAAWFFTPPLPPLDDAYISVDSAQSLLAGGDLQYGSPPLTGITSPPYVLLLTILLKLGLPAVPALRIASAMGAAALIVALWLLARSTGLVGWRQFVLPVLVLAAGPVIHQATNGVETGWAMAAGTALIAASVAGRPIAAAVAAGTLPWLRPDLSPMAGLLFVAAIRKQPSSVRLRALAVATIVFIPWTFWLHSHSGSWIPQTMEAKAAFFAEGCRPLGAKLPTVGRAVVAWFTLLLPASFLAIVWIPRSTSGRLGLVASTATIAAYAALLPGGLWHNNQRYMYAIGVPWLALGLTTSMQSRKLVWRTAVLAVFVASLALWSTRHGNWSDEATERIAVATWISEHVDSRARLLTQDAGVISVFTTNPLVDLVGLKTPASVIAHRRWTWPTCGADRGKAVADIARSSGAEYLIVTTEWDAIFSLSRDLRQQGFTLQEIRSASGAPYSYKVYRMGPPSQP